MTAQHPTLVSRIEIVEGINRILQATVTSETEQELGRTCVAVGLELTNSEFGFIGEIGEDGRLYDVAMSEMAWDLCHLREGTHHSWPSGNGGPRGLLDAVLVPGRPVIVNEPRRHPSSVGVPSGHPPLTAFLGVPLREHGRSYGMIAMANRPGGYGPEEQRALEAIEPAIVQAFRRKRAELELRRSEEKYRTLFNSIDEAFCIVEVLFDVRGNPVDYLFLETNAVFEKQSGLVDAIGKSMRALAPDHDERWYEVYGRIALTGRPERFEAPSAALGRDWDVFAFRIDAPSKHHVAILFRDVTERKRSEAESAMLAGLIDDFAGLSTEQEFVQALGNRLGEYLGADSVLFAESDTEHGTVKVTSNWSRGAIPDLTGVHALSSFLTEELERAAATGRPIVVDDAQNDPKTASAYAALNVRSFVTVPFGRDLSWKCLFTVNLSRPRAWSDHEVRLIEAVTNRTFARLERARAEQRIRESEYRLRAAEKAAGLGIHDFDLRSGRIEWDERVRAIWEVPESSPVTYDVFLEGLHPDDRAATEAAVRAAFDPEGDGHYYAEYRVLGRSSGVERWVAATGEAFFEGREPVRLIGTVQDITERKRSEDALRRSLARTQLLGAVARAAASTLDLGELSTNALQVLHDNVGARLGGVYQLDQAEATLRALSLFGHPPQERGLFENVPLDAGSYLGRAVLEDRDYAVDSEYVEQTPGAAARISAAGIEKDSWIIVPLSSAGRAIGALVVVFEGKRSLDAEEIELYRSVASTLSLAMENARLYEAEHDIAETLQETLVVLPERVRGIDFSRAYESATFETGRVGGDFIDVFEVDDDTVALTLGDVSGKGIEAAVTTSLLRTTLRTYALDGLAPSEIAFKANRMMRRFTSADSFVTMWFGLLNTSTGELSYICAGHPPALVLAADGALRELECKDPILGAFDDTAFCDCQSTLGPHERILLYSDGLSESRSPSGEFLGDEGLRDVVARHAGQPTRALGNAVMDEVIRFSDGVLRDDAALLAVEPNALRQAPDARAEDPRGQAAWGKTG